MIPNLDSASAWTPPPPIEFVEAHDRSDASSDPAGPAKAEWVEKWRRLAQIKVESELTDASELNAPDEELFRKLHAQQTAAQATRQAISLRIDRLRQQALADGELFNKRSESDFDRFILQPPFLKLPYIFLLESGNIRAVWKGSDGQHLGLQFLGDGEVEYVIFANRDDATRLARVAGRDSASGVNRQISAFSLGGLISE